MLENPWLTDPALTKKDKQFDSGIDTRQYDRRKDKKTVRVKDRQKPQLIM